MKINIKKLNICYRRLLIIWFFSYHLVYPMVSRVTNTRISECFYTVLFLFLLIKVWSKKKTRIKKDAIILLAFTICSMCVTWIFFPEYKDVLFGLRTSYDKTYDFAKSVLSFHGPLWGYLVIRTEDDMERLFDYLTTSAWIVWIAYTIKSFNGVAVVRNSEWTGNIVTLNYNQTYGFWFLFSALIFLLVAIKRKKKIYLLPFSICLIQILMYASRTAVMSLACYLVLYMYMEGRDKGKLYRKIIWSIVLILFATMLSSSTFMGFIGDCIKSLGLSSKVIDALVSGDNTIDGGRLYLFEEGWKIIKSHPLGAGVFCDRYYLNFYVHNLLIEILMNFGWFLGGGLILYLLMVMKRMFWTEVTLYKSFFIMFFSLCMVRLTLSYSFWLDTNFFMMIAMSASYKEYMKKRS